MYQHGNIKQYLAYLEAYVYLQACIISYECEYVRRYCCTRYTAVPGTTGCRPYYLCVVIREHGASFPLQYENQHGRTLGVLDADGCIQHERLNAKNMHTDTHQRVHVMVFKTTRP